MCLCIYEYNSIIRYCIRRVSAIATKHALSMRLLLMLKYLKWSSCDMQICIWTKYILTTNIHNMIDTHITCLWVCLCLFDCNMNVTCCMIATTRIYTSRLFILCSSFSLLLIVHCNNSYITIILSNIHYYIPNR